LWPVYLPLSKGAGSVIGWVEFAHKTSSDLDGQLIWTKPGGSTVYPDGFTSQIWVTGSTYTPPPTGNRAVNISNGYLKLKGPGWDAATAFKLDANNKVTGAGLSMTISPTSGWYKGSVVSPWNGQTVSFQGVLSQKANLGAGFFLDGGQSGNASLSSAP